MGKPDKPILVREVWRPVPTIRRRATPYEQANRQRNAMGLVGAVLIVVPVLIFAKVLL